MEWIKFECPKKIVAKLVHVDGGNVLENNTLGNSDVRKGLDAYLTTESPGLREVGGLLGLTRVAMVVGSTTISTSEWLRKLRVLLISFHVTLNNLTWRT